MKIISYNINGIRASIKLGLKDWILNTNADIYCFQEVRCNENLAHETLFNENSQINMFNTTNLNSLSNYYPIFNCGERAGYAGTLTLSKIKPDKIMHDMGEIWQDNEGRTTTIFIKNTAIINAYIPNGTTRLEYKMQYLSALQKFIEKLQQNYSVICVGDYNIAHNEIDLTNPKECKNKSVFLPIERQAFDKFLSLGMIDCFRYLNPKEIKYSWRSYRSLYDTSYNSWKYRIDYILASENLKSKLLNCNILDVNYSDHLPVIAEINFN